MNVLLGVSGSISAYKAVEVLRLFQKKGHQVSVILTKNAARFVAPLTFETFAPGKVYTDMFSPNQDPLLHIHLCQSNDLLLVAPATANIIAKMANGIADDLLSTACLVFEKEVVVAPAMNTAMYENPAVQENIRRLQTRGLRVLEPEAGSLACVTEGKGRLPSAEAIYNFCQKIEHV